MGQQYVYKGWSWDHHKLVLDVLILAKDWFKYIVKIDTGFVNFDRVKNCTRGVNFNRVKINTEGVKFVRVKIDTGVD